MRMSGQNEALLEGTKSTCLNLMDFIVVLMNGRFATWIVVLIFEKAMAQSGLPDLIAKLLGQVSLHPVLPGCLALRRKLAGSRWSGGLGYLGQTCPELLDVGAFQQHGGMDGRPAPIDKDRDVTRLAYDKQLQDPAVGVWFFPQRYTAVLQTSSPP